MRTRARPSIDEIAKLSSCSKATVDRVLHGRAGVHPRTRDKVNQALAQLEEEYENRAIKPFGASLAPRAPQRFGFIVQAGQAFTESFLTAIEKQRNGNRALEIQGMGAPSNEAVVEAIKGWTDGLDGLAVVSKNIPPITDELKRLREAGKRVLALVSDIELSARSAYLGIDNRAAGNVAAYLMGRHLEGRLGAQVAVVVGSFSYRCHEDREIGFRSIMRQHFESVEVLEVIKGEDSDEATYNAARKLLRAKPNILGVYNVAGGNRGLAQAVGELQHPYRPVYITHELNRVTEPLLRTEQIDYLIVQDLDEMVRRAIQFMREIPDGDRGSHTLEHVSFRLLTQFNIG
jgi:LacI family transcriptional regulator, galactose operon repressor